MIIKEILSKYKREVDAIVNEEAAEAEARRKTELKLLEKEPDQSFVLNKSTSKQLLGKRPASDLLNSKSSM